MESDIGPQAPSRDPAGSRPLRLLALTCEVLARPVYHCAARSPHIVDVRLERRGLHDDPPNLRSILQAEIDVAGPVYDAVVLAYGLCGGAAAGLVAGDVPLVVPRAHDCITLFLGSRRRYTEETTTTPGTYWYVQDYIERTDDASPFTGVGAVSDAELRATYDQYVERYGRDNADYLMEAMGSWLAHYDRAAFIDLGVGDSAAVEAQARVDAERRGWRFERMAGELLLIRRLIDADWSADDFLVVQPGARLAMAYDDGVIRAEPPEPAEGGSGAADEG